MGEEQPDFAQRAFFTGGACALFTAYSCVVYFGRVWSRTVSEDMMSLGAIAFFISPIALASLYFSLKVASARWFYLVLSSSYFLGWGAILFADWVGWRSP